MVTPSDPPVPSTVESEQVEEAANRFAEAWRGVAGPGERADLRAFLPPPERAVLRRAVLEELIRIDLDARWRRRQPALLEEYVRDFPELGPLDSLPARLIFDEFRARRQPYGDRVPLEAYQARFPRQYLDLRLLAHERTDGAPADSWSPPSTVPPLPLSPTAALPPLPGGAARYRLLDRIDGGAYGVVFRAEAPGGVLVAVKIIHGDAGDRAFQQERRALEMTKNLKNIYLVHPHAYWVENGQLHIAMDLASGSLRDRCRQCVGQGLLGIPVPELLGYCREAAEALDYLHEQKLHHRDIKPANILLFQGHAKLADFGLARESAATFAPLSAFAGTPLYTAPEVWGGNWSEHSDQFSLAATYVELRQGRPAFAGKSHAEVMNKILTGKPDLGGLTGPEARVIRRALAKDYRRRFPSCRAFIDALKEAVEPPKPTPTRPLWLLALIVLGIVLSIAALVVPRIYPGRPTNGEGVTIDEPEAPVQVVTDKTEAMVSLPVHADAGRVARLDVRPDALPKGLTVAAAPPDGSSAIRVRVAATRQAAPRLHPIPLHIEEDGRQLASVTLLVRVVYLPGGCEPVGDDTVKDADGRFFFRKVRFHVPGVEEPVEFVLVPREDKKRLPTGEANPESFYIMRDKVWVNLVRAYANAHKEKLEKWRRDHWGGPDDGPLPAMFLTWDESAEIARALFGGELPLPVQWDKASGRFWPNRGAGPFKGPRVAISPKDGPMLVGPMRVGAAADDVSVFGCRDMAGNGFEWTRLKSDDLVEQRGCSYESPEPWRFENLEGPNPLVPRLRGDWRRKDTTFRAVLELP